MADDEYGEGDFEYRVRERVPGANTFLAEWRTVITNRGNGRPYFSIGAARGILTREKKRDERRNRGMAGNLARELRIERRPVEASWEVVE